MSKTNDGGPAYPTLGESFVTGPDGLTQPASAYGMDGAPGMSLRDYFAGQAVSGLTADPAHVGKPPDYARVAYQIADAMLAERSKGGSK